MTDDRKLYMFVYGSSIAHHCIAFCIELHCIKLRGHLLSNCKLKLKFHNYLRNKKKYFYNSHTLNIFRLKLPTPHPFILPKCINKRTIGTCVRETIRTNN